MDLDKTDLVELKMKQTHFEHPHKRNSGTNKEPRTSQ
jgi:hypothetical protein